MHPRSRPHHELRRAAVFRPPRAAGVATGLGLAVVAVVAAAVVGWIAGRSEPEFRTFLGWLAAGGLVTAAAVFVSWSLSLATLAYTVRPGALVITWGFRRTVIALDSIEAVLPGRTVDEVKVSGLNWWGCHVGFADIRRVGFTLVYATGLDPERMVFVTTADESYALSVPRPTEFAEAVQAHRGLGPVPGRTQRALASGVAALPLWRDRSAVGSILVSAVGCALVVGFVFSQYPGLAPVVEINFPGVADVVRVGNKQELLHIAYAAVAVFVVNGLAGSVVHASDRAAGLWLLASGSLLEGLLFAAAVLAFSHT